MLHQILSGRTKTRAPFEIDQRDVLHDVREGDDVLILPVSSEANGVERAQQLMAGVANQRTHCTMVVFHDGPRPREIASRADVRAGNDPFREVVWIPDVAVLAGNDRFRALLARCQAQEEAVALTLRFEVSSCLHGATAMSFFELERAFAAALAGQVAP